MVVVLRDFANLLLLLAAYGDTCLPQLIHDMNGVDPTPELWPLESREEHGHRQQDPPASQAENHNEQASVRRIGVGDRMSHAEGEGRASGIDSHCRREWFRAMWTRNRGVLAQEGKDNGVALASTVVAAVKWRRWIRSPK
jgi:hypothetical protein